LLQIDRKVISLDIFEEKFACNLPKCKGMCCVFGDSGAPLENSEVNILNNIYPEVKPFLREEGIEAIEKSAPTTIDDDGDFVTPLINNKECAYTYKDGFVFKCALERAYIEKKIGFRKPFSCHLFPIRIRKYGGFEGIIYEKWEICGSARELGAKLNIPVYRFLKDPLIRKYGKKWYKKLEIAADEILKNRTD
jgi:hypothetical protein